MTAKTNVLRASSQAEGAPEPISQGDRVLSAAILVFVAGFLAWATAGFPSVLW